MDNEKILHFIAEKIQETKLAIFYCHSKSALKIKNHVIETFRVDENGNISFFINRPSQLISQFEQEFPATLCYFKKGNNYHLTIFGKASIVNDPEELMYQLDLSDEEKKTALTTLILIKVKIQTVDFHDKKFDYANQLVKKVRSLYNRVFDAVGMSSKTYDFTPRTTLQHFGI